MPDVVKTIVSWAIHDGKKFNGKNKEQEYS